MSKQARIVWERMQLLDKLRTENLAKVTEVMAVLRAKALDGDLAAIREWLPYWVQKMPERVQVEDPSKMPDEKLLAEVETIRAKILAAKGGQ